MTKTKSKLLSILVVLCLTIPLMFMLTACGNKHEHDFKGLTYVVEDEKAYEVKTCSCGEKQKTEMEDTIVANTTNVVTKIASAEAGTTIVLAKGNYGIIKLEGLDAFKDDITLTAFDEVSVDGLLITSKLTKQNYLDEEKTFAEMGENLTITNIEFKDDIQVRNCTLSGLTIKNCKFTGEARIDVKADSFFATYSTNPSARDGDIPKFGMDDNAMVNGTNISNEIVNITVENNTFEGVHDSILNDTTVIYLSKVNGATVKNNIIDNAEFNGIQITGSTGVLLVEGNTIKSSGSRSMRFSYLEDRAELTDKLIVKNNTLSNANTLETNSEVVKSSSTSTVTIEFEGNTYNGEAISVGNGITKA